MSDYECVVENNFDGLVGLKGKIGYLRANWLLRVAARYGRLEMCRWLRSVFELTHEDSRAGIEYVLSWAAIGGHLDVCKWLESTYGLTRKDAELAFHGVLRFSDGPGSLDVYKWLESTYTFNVENARRAIWNGHTDACEQLYSTYGISNADARAREKYALLYADEPGRLEVCQRLHTTFNLTPADWGVYATSAHPATVEWVRRLTAELATTA